jgi:tetratricopeptide (TPR) repeat protein
MLGFAYRNAGRLEDAAREFRASIRLDPANAAEAHNDLGAVLNEQGRTSEAIEEFRRALALRPLPEIAVNLVLALDAAGRRDEAIAEAERFLARGAGGDPRYAAMLRAQLARLRAGR